MVQKYNSGHILILLYTLGIICKVRVPSLQLKECFVVFKFYKTSDIKSTVQLERVLCEDLQHVQQQDQMPFLD